MSINNPEPNLVPIVTSPSGVVGSVNPQPKPRISVLEQVVYQVPGEEPHATVTRFSKPSFSTEQPFSRRLSVNGNWQKIPTGWLQENEVGFIVIRNDEGRFTQVVPSTQEVAEVMARILDIGVQIDNSSTIQPLCVIHPQENLRFFPTEINRLRIRSRWNIAKTTIVAYPR